MTSKPEIDFQGTEVELRNVTKKFADVVAVDNVSLVVRGGEFLTLLGPSGSGKTTILMMIAGFVQLTWGKIFVNRNEITYLQPYKRNVGMTFQNYALFPHKTVFENIAFPLRMRKLDTEHISKKVEWALELVQLSGLGKRYPKQLSGGQQQRIALARSLVFSPSVLLMDEPLGALDKKLREHMKLEIKHIQKNLNITVIYVTHDQEEALTMSNRIAIINQGKIEQIGPPETIYEKPANEFVADFIGESNFIEGEHVRDIGEVSLIQSRGGLLKVPKSEKLYGKREIKIVIRPEKIKFVNSRESQEDYNTAEGIIEEIIYIGEVTKFKVNTLFSRGIVLKEQNRFERDKWNVGDKVRIGWKLEDATSI